MNYSEQIKQIANRSYNNKAVAASIDCTEFVSAFDGLDIDEIFDMLDAAQRHMSPVLRGEVDDCRRALEDALTHASELVLLANLKK